MYLSSGCKTPSLDSRRLLVDFSVRRGACVEDVRRIEGEGEDVELLRLEVERAVTARIDLNIFPSCPFADEQMPAVRRTIEKMKG